MAKKSQSNISAVRIATEKQLRYNPLRGLSPQKLVTALENFEAGYIADLARLFDMMRRRDDMISAALDKRKKSVAGLDWTITGQGEDEKKSALHQEALEEFFNHITVDSVNVPERVGGVELLVEQMLSAIEMQYSVHEVVWHPTLSRITAEFHFVPLWYFENTTGRLRFKRNSFETFGEDMVPGEWVTVATEYPLLEPASSAFIFKRMAMGDWSIFSRRFGSGTAAYKTSATKGSPEWREANDVVANFSNNIGFVLSKEDEFDLIQASATGLPFPALIERMDRALAVIFRGSDLATLSSKNGTGASLQADEAALLENSDCALIESAIEKKISTPLLQMMFGRDVVPAAYFQFTRRDRTDKEAFLKLVRSATELGCAPKRAFVFETLGWAQPESGDDITALGANAPAPAASLSNEDTSPAPDIIALAKARGADIAAVVSELERIAAESPNPADWLSAMEILSNDLPLYLKGGKNEAAALSQFMSRAAKLGIKTKNENEK